MAELDGVLERAHAALERIRPWRRGAETASHKPLLILWALRRVQLGMPRLTDFNDAEAELRQLIAQFSPDRERVHPEYPFWRLQADGLWEVEHADDFPSRQSNSDPPLSVLRGRHALGGFPESLHEALGADPRAVDEVALRVLHRFFDADQHATVLKAVGFDPATVLIRVRYDVSGAYARRGESLAVRTGQDGLIVEVVIAKLPQVDDPTKPRITITATASVAPHSDIRDGLTRLVDGLEASEDLLEYGSKAARQAAAEMIRVFELLRWRSNAGGRNHPYAFRGADFSLDGGDTWTRLPTQTHAAIRRAGALQLDGAIAQELDGMARDGAGEPLAHQLLREAFDVASGNPRSAIVIGVAAAETGFKQLLETLVPDAAWLVGKLPSPPLVRMLREYLPTLPARLDFEGAVHAPPKYARTLLTSAVEERNRVAHTGNVAISQTELTETLGCVRDLLYLFDYYVGHEWAVDALSEKFRAALGT